MKTRKRTRRILTDEERREMVRLYTAGVPPRIVGERFGLSSSSICNHARREAFRRCETVETMMVAIVRQVARWVGSTVVRNFPHIIAAALQKLPALAAASFEQREQFYLNTIAAIRSTYPAPQPEEMHKWLN